MRRLSFWAKNNPRQARTIIVLSHVILVTNALLLGFLTYAFDLKLPYWELMLSANLFMLACLSYPARNHNKGWFKYSYIRQKSTDFFLLVTFSFVLVFGLNQFALSPEFSPQSSQPNAILIVHHVKPEAKSGKTEKSELRKSIRKMKKGVKAELRQLKRTYKKQNKGGKSNGLKIFLIVLTVAVAIGLGLLIAAFSCSLACSGADALAVLLLILGWGGIIWLSIIAIKNILIKVGAKNGNRAEMEP